MIFTIEGLVFNLLRSIFIAPYYHVQVRTFGADPAAGGASEEQEQPPKCVFATRADGSTAVCSPRGLCISSLAAPPSSAGARIPAATACATLALSNSDDQEAAESSEKENATPTETTRSAGQQADEETETSDAQMEVDENANGNAVDERAEDEEKDEAASEKAFSVASSRDEMSSSSAKLRDLKLFVCYSNAQVALMEPFCVCAFPVAICIQRDQYEDASHFFTAINIMSIYNTVFHGSHVSSPSCVDTRSLCSRCPHEPHSTAASSASRHPPTAVCARGPMTWTRREPPRARGIRRR